jgi:hypothetical protein
MPSFKVKSPNKDYHKLKDEDMQLVYELGTFATALWNAQKNAGKVCVSVLWPLSPVAVLVASIAKGLRTLLQKS